MDRTDVFGRYSPLARRMILWVVLFSSVVTLVLTAFQLYRGYRMDLSAIDDEFRQIEGVHVPTLSQQVWATDFAAVQLELDGMMGLRDLQYVEVRDDAGGYFHAGRPATTKSIAREYPLRYFHRGQEQHIGNLRVVISLDGVFRRLLDTAVVVLLSNAVKTFLVAGFMLVLFNRLIGRNLSGIARRAETLTLDNLENAIESVRTQRRVRTPDEIDSLIAALNQMRRGLQASRDALAASERRYRNLFEQAQDGIVIADPKTGKILDANPFMAALTGYSRAELLNTTVVDLAPSDARADAEATLRRVVAAGQARFERLLQHKDGHMISVEVSVRVVDLAEQTVIMGVVYDMSERRRAEAEMLRLGRILDESSNEIYVFRADTLRFVNVNRGALQNLGYSPEELHQLTPLDLKPEFTPESFEELLYPLRRGSTEQLTFATQHRRKDGSLYPIEVRLHLSRREQPPLFVAVVMDISERRRAEYEIEESRRKLESVVTSAPVVLWAVDPKGVFTLSEGKGLAQLGLVPGEVVGQSVFDVYRDYPNVLTHVRRALAGESFAAEVNVAALWFEVHYAPAHDPRGQRIGAMGVAVDITERRHAEQMLRAERDFSSGVLETVGSMVVVLDSGGRIVRFNRACEKLTGYRFDEVKGQHIWERLIPSEQVDAVKGVFANLAAGSRYSQYENDWLTRAGERRLIAWSNTNLVDTGGKVAFVIATGIDITDRRHAEAEREQLLAELQTRNVEMENFVYTVSHDLKNPLITIGGFASLLDRDIASGKLELAKDSITEINKAVTLLKQHIEDMLTLSRAGRVIADTRPLLLSQLVDEVLASTRERVDATGAVISVMPDLPEVVVSEEGFRRVYTNLIDNALQYRRAGVTPRVDIGWQRAGTALRLFVRDNGVGIKPQYLERVFGLFQRLDTHTEGTGVGLAISRRVVEAHGGNMWVESEFDSGSTFWLSLPESVIVGPAVHPHGLDANTG
jgi:PAS domain S-box-containing protein